MTVLQCAGCPRFISVSAIPGGNAVAKADPQRWSVTHVRCSGCGAALCDRCAVEDGGHCKRCGAALPRAAGAGRAAPAAQPAPRHGAEARARLTAIAWGRHLAVLALIVQGSWPLVVMMSTSRALTQSVYGLSVLLGMLAAWKMQTGMRSARWARMLGGLSQLVVLVSILVLLVLRRRAASAMVPLQAADDGDQDDTPSARAPAAAPARAASSRAPSGAKPVDIVAQRISQAMGKPWRGYATYDFGREREPAARSILVEKNFSPALLDRLRRMLPPGLVLFLGTDRWLGDEDHGSAVELVIAPGRDFTDMVRMARVDPVNHGLDAEKVAAKLREYDRQYGIQLDGANTDTVSFQFKRLPDDLVALTEDLIEFCPDLGDALPSAEALAALLRKSNGCVELWWD